jgi:hypothetical protein
LSWLLLLLLGTVVYLLLRLLRLLLLLWVLLLLRVLLGLLLLLLLWVLLLLLRLHLCLLGLLLLVNIVGHRDLLVGAGGWQPRVTRAWGQSRTRRGQDGTLRTLWATYPAVRVCLLERQADRAVLPVTMLPVSNYLS